MARSYCGGKLNQGNLTYNYSENGINSTERTMTAFVKGT